jgi:hypothetical protein
MLIFVWLPLEENSVTVVTLLGVGLSGLLVAHVAVRRAAHSHTGIATAGYGALFGAGAALGTALLMFLKTASHAHPYPDFSPLLMLSMLERLPAWTLAGALGGLGVALIRSRDGP